MIFLEHEIDKHGCWVGINAIGRKIDILLMSPKKHLKYEVSIELYSHYIVDFSLIDVFKKHNKVISKNYRFFIKWNAHGITLKHRTIIKTFKYYFLFASNLDTNF